MDIDVSYTPPGDDAETSSLAEFLNRLPLHVESFRADGDTDREVLEKAFAAWQIAGGELNLEPGRLYDLGEEAGAPASIFTLAGLEKSSLRGNGATLQVETVGNADYNVLYLQNFDGLEIRDLHCTDTADPGNGSYGANFIVATGGAGACNDLRLVNVSAEDMRTFIGAQGSGARVTGVYVDPSCWAKSVFYCISCINNGDNFTGGFTAYNPNRAYFPYGVSDHDLSIDIVNDGGSGGADVCCLIKRYQSNTFNIRLRLTLSGTLVDMGHIVALEHQNNDGAASIIDDIHISFHVRNGTADPGPATRLLLRSYSTSGSENASSAHYTGFVSIAGQLGKSANPHIKANYVPLVPGVIAVGEMAGRSMTKTVDAPGFLIQTGPDTFQLEKFGNLTSSALSIPIPDLNGYRWAFKVTVYAEPNHPNTDGTASKLHYREDLVAGYSNASGANNVGFVTGSPVNLVNQGFNSSNFALGYSGGTNVLILTPSGSNYNVSTAYMKVGIECVGRTLSR